MDTLSRVRASLRDVRVLQVVVLPPIACSLSSIQIVWEEWEHTAGAPTVQPLEAQDPTIGVQLNLIRMATL